MNHAHTLLRKMSTVDKTVPNPNPLRPMVPRTARPAGVQSMLLGERDHVWELDRQLGEEVMQAMPALSMITQAAQSFIDRATAYCRARDVRQFLFLGTGFPTTAMPHQRMHQCRCVYVDPDQCVHLQTVLQIEASGTPGLHSAFCADVRSSNYVWAQTVAQNLLRRRTPTSTAVGPVRKRIMTTAVLSPHEPIALVLSTELELVPRGAAMTAAITHYKSMLPSGSFVIAAHTTADGIPRELARQLAQVRAVYAREGQPRTRRSRAGFTALFDGLELIGPGVVWAPLWRPDPSTTRLTRPGAPSASCTLAAVGRKP